MNKGRLLVYPTAFQCPKCTNTGYKSNDPSHPCRKVRFTSSLPSHSKFNPLLFHIVMAHKSVGRNMDDLFPLPFFSPPVRPPPLLPLQSRQTSNVPFAPSRDLNNHNQPPATIQVDTTPPLWEEPMEDLIR